MSDELTRMEEKKVVSQEMFRGTMLHLNVDLVDLPNGKLDHREFVRHVGAVCIIPVTEDGKIVVERQFRYPIGQIVTEIPAGKLNDRDEDPLEAAKRELREETGLTADAWENLGVFYPAPAYSDEKITMFLARGLHQGPCERDDDEFMDVLEMPLAELEEQVLSGEVTDAKTQIAVLKAAKLLK